MLTSKEILELKSPPDELLEMHLYQCLEVVRWRYYNNQIDKETALKLKARYCKKYESQRKQFELWIDIYKETLEERRKIEWKMIQFNKNPSIELAKEIIKEMI